MPSTSPTSAPFSWLRLKGQLAIGVALLLVAAGLIFAPGAVPPADAEDEGVPALEAAEAAEAEQVVAPELDGGTAWLNSAGPLRLADLKGRIVILDFWTLCCINCMHMLPDLAKLEQLYHNFLVVIGIHTPKFEDEKETESIRKAILRYEISHPVVNDAEGILWRRYRVSGWPTLVMIDPEGNVCYMQSGEGQYQALEAKIKQLATVYRAKKMLNEKPLKFELARSTETGESPLFFPGKVLADQASNRLFIADSTHHRIVITDLAGKMIAVAGTGVPGFQDGTFEKAAFSDPQGMALSGNYLYVADRRNHAIRKLDLKNKTVSHVAGTGQQNGSQRQFGGPALKTGLNSPWDLLLQGNKLFIAMAGHHQIWMLDLEKSHVDPVAGTGDEDIADGPVGLAKFAQPSGLTTDGKTLWVADSETSSIRAVPLIGNGGVQTVVGQGLFEYGDIDGQGDKVRLQHALGVAYRDGKLYVADTYNSKIKVIDPVTRVCSTFVGEKKSGLTAPPFNAPGGLSFAGNKLYVADTNGHRIQVIDMTTREVTTLPLEGVTAPKLPESKEKK